MSKVMSRQMFISYHIIPTIQSGVVAMYVRWKYFRASLLPLKPLILPSNMHIVKHACNENNFSISIVVVIRIHTHFITAPSFTESRYRPSINDIVNYTHFRLRSWLLTNISLRSCCQAYNKLGWTKSGARSLSKMKWLRDFPSWI